MLIKKRNTLLKIAKVLNDRNVQWGIGASLMLQSLGLVDEVNDIDLVIAEKDMDKAIEAIELIAVHIRVPQKDEYLTRYFDSFNIDGVDVDVMSGFRIKHSEGIYEFPMDETSIVRTENIEGVEIPFTSVEDWYVAYMLMKGRESKVKLIEAYFGKEGIGHPELLTNSLKQELPVHVRKRIMKVFM